MKSSIALRSFSSSAWTKIFLIYGIIMAFLLTGLRIHAQEASYDNYTGIWSDDVSWIDGSSPGTTVDGIDIIINGYITLNGDFDFNNGLLEIYDTLIVNGNFLLRNNGNLSMSDSAVLIIFGDYTSDNQVFVNTGGYFIVTGEFEMMGADNQGSFNNGGAVFIFDDTPQIKTGSGYGDLACPDTSDYPDNCGYGNEYDILDDPINDFFEECYCMHHDIEDPVISAPPDLMINVDPGTCIATSVILGSPTTSDNCSVASVTNDASEPYALGTTVITWTVTDRAGNSASASQNVTVIDTTDPQISCPEDVIQCAENPMDANITGIQPLVLSDNCVLNTLTYFTTGATNRNGNDDASGTFNVGTSSVSYIVTDASGNSATCSFNVIVNPIPDITLDGENRCGAGELLLTAVTNQGNSVEFSMDGGTVIATSDNSEPYEFTPAIEEEDTLAVTARAVNIITGCASDWTPEILLTAYTLPVTGAITPDSPGINHFDEACIASRASYSVEHVPGSTHNWSIPSLSFIARGTDSITFDWDIGEGEHSLQVVQISPEGCAGSVTEEFVYVSDLWFSLGPDQEICEGDEYVFEPDEEFATYQWHDGSTQSHYTASQTGVVRLTVTDIYGCSASDDVMLVVLDGPDPDLGKDTSLCGEVEYELYGGEFESYEWSTGDVSSSIKAYPGNQTIWLRVTDENDCVAIDTIRITKCDSKKLFELITNTFTPNNDGIHDTWVINNIDRYPNAQIKVFDHTGRLVFESDGSYENDWDGSFNGEPLPVDTYYYLIEFNSDELEPVRGAITIIR